MEVIRSERLLSLIHLISFTFFTFFSAFLFEFNMRVFFGILVFLCGSEARVYSINDQELLKNCDVDLWDVTKKMATYGTKELTKYITDCLTNEDRQIVVEYLNSIGANLDARA